jgi:hypothetical protein
MVRVVVVDLGDRILPELGISLAPKIAPSPR